MNFDVPISDQQAVIWDKDPCGDLSLRDFETELICDDEWCAQCASEREGSLSEGIGWGLSITGAALVPIAFFCPPAAANWLCWIAIAFWTIAAFLIGAVRILPESEE